MTASEVERWHRVRMILDAHQGTAVAMSVKTDPATVGPFASMSPMPILETVRKDHVVQQMLCRDLETVADGLPGLPTQSEVQALCRRIQRVTTQHFERAEAAFATLPEMQRPEARALAMLHHMHQLDELHAQDVMSILEEQSRYADSQRTEQLAYMLRCFFDGCRRLIALKESWIMSAEFRSLLRSD